MPIHGSLFQEYAETTGQDPFTLQNKKMLKIQMQYGPVNTKLGSMVAYQGDARFAALGKRYVYRLRRGEVLPPFEGLRETLAPRQLDVAAMREAASCLTGRHD